MSRAFGTRKEALAWDEGYTSSSSATLSWVEGAKYSRNWNSDSLIKQIQKVHAYRTRQIDDVNSAVTSSVFTKGPMDSNSWNKATRQALLLTLEKRLEKPGKHVVLNLPSYGLRARELSNMYARECLFKLI
jgi:hypothetical protein